MNFNQISPVQQKELDRRIDLHKNETIHFGYVCVCGFDFLASDESYMVDGVEYPIITGYCDHEGDRNWTEHHKCPKCSKETQFNDGT